MKNKNKSAKKHSVIDKKERTEIYSCFVVLHLF